jgi:TonB-dependent Receptor Plug Domain
MCWENGGKLFSLFLGMLVLYWSNISAFIGGILLNFASFAPFLTTHSIHFFKLQHMNRLLLLSVLTYFTQLLPALSQNKTNGVQQVEKLRDFAAHYPQVKIFLHTDKPYYVSGDTLWFAAYGAVGPEQTPDTVTATVYVDLYSIKDEKPIAQQKILLNYGRGAGSIALADSLPSGEYGLRAYSLYMRNFPETDFFQRRIQIYDPARLEEAPQPARDTTLADCRFFPESGVFLAGANNNIAFKAVDAAGRGVGVRGVVLDERGDTAAVIGSEYLGMGVFSLKPRPEARYRALIRAGLQEKTFDLPQVEKNGYTFSVSSLGKGQNVRMLIFNGRPDAEKQLTVLVHARGRVVYAADIKAALPEQLLNIPRLNFAAGLNSVTLFDPNGRPVCERLVYIWKDKPMRLSITPEKPECGPKDPVTLNLTATDAEGKPVAGHFSVAVTDAGQVLEDTFSDHLLSYLMLSSELRGAIEAPAAYFDPRNTKAPVYLDCLLMTQGWRRYDWRKILDADNKAPLSFPVEPGLSIKGQIARTNGKPFKKSVDLTMLLRDVGGDQLLSCQTDASGAFQLDGLFFQDSARLLLNLPERLDPSMHEVSLAPDNPAPFQRAAVPPAQYDKSAEELKDRFSKSAEWQAFLKRRAAVNDVLLSAIDIKAKKKETADKYEAKRGIFGKPSTSVSLTDEMRSSVGNPLQILQGRVSGVQIKCNGFDCSAQIRGAASLSGGAIEALYMIDGVPIDRAGLQAISVQSIEAIDIIKSGAMLGARGAGGAINFITRTGADILGGPSGVSMLKVSGYNIVKQFYVPRYDLADSPERSLPDFRSVVYWNPDVATDASGKAQIKFFTSDATGIFRVEAQGVGETGKPGVGTGRYRVQ